MVIAFPVLLFTMNDYMVYGAMNAMLLVSVDDRIPVTSPQSRPLDNADATVASPTAQVLSEMGTPVFELPALNGMYAYPVANLPTFLCSLQLYSWMEGFRQSTYGWSKVV